MSHKELAEYTYVSRYSNFLPDKKRREKWKESCDRVRNMMLEKYADIEEAIPYINQAYDAMEKKQVLGSQRALQFGGKPIMKHNTRIYNCFKESTKFITNNGVFSFSDFNDGDEVNVLTHLGNWKPAQVKKYGKQKLNKITLKKGSSKDFVIYATENHRWILDDGTETTSLSVGDCLYRQPNIFNDWDYDSAEPDERLYWAYGLVYGDGTKIKNKNGEYKHSMIRLCGDDKQYKERFEELGFKTTSSDSLDGDFIAYTGTYIKTLPDPKIDDIRLVRAFVRGFLDADGAKNRNYKNIDTRTMFLSIQQSKKEAQQFIRNVFPSVGVYVISEKEINHETNFGEHDAIHFRINTGSGQNNSPKWKVVSIDNYKEEEVWCLEVEDDNSFVMPNGICTGNCTASIIDRVDFFKEAMYWLLSGTGVGFSVQKHHVDRLPYLVKEKKGTKKYVVEDSIIGWADAIGVIVASYFKQSDSFPEYVGKNVNFDFSQISPKGTPLNSCSGKAPGPKPLKKAIEKIDALLSECMVTMRKIRPIHAHDIVCHSADAVISGGVRRSACISIFSKDDEEMMSCKTGNWGDTNPQRARANNSALLVRDELTKKEFNEFVEKNTRQFGEPGFIFSDSYEIVYNPCCEIGLIPYLITDEKLFKKYCATDGFLYKLEGKPEEAGLKSGWQCCNLTTINCKKIKTVEDYLLAVENATILGTLQAGFSDFPYLGSTTEEIVRREALLGVSMIGVMEKPDICLSPEIQRQAAKHAVEKNKWFAKILGINQAARVTTQKPDGNSACFLGNISSGIHPHHYKRYFRNVQANKQEEVYKYFKEHNPLACEPCAWSENNTDDTITFCIEVPDGAKLKNQISSLELLEYVKSTQINWIGAGKNKDLCVQPYLNHSVSNTIHVKDEEWPDVIDYVYKNRKFFAGISLISVTGDKDYKQAPNTAVYLPTEMVSYYGDCVVFASGLIEEAMNLYDDDLWDACNVLLGIGKQIRGSSKRKWKERCEKFASKYLEGDIKKLTYLMKDVYNWKRWLDLNREYKSVDYTKMFEEEDNTNFQGESACAGGACEI